MNKRNLFFILIIAGIIILGFNLNKTESAGGIGTWKTTPYCYKHMGPAGPKGLYENVQTCNAGFSCYEYGCGDDACFKSIEEPDCGENNIKCFSAANISGRGNCAYAKTIAPQDGPKAGCLNYKCSKEKGGKNAIWDPQSKKCGCDDGHWEGGSGSGSGLSNLLPTTQTPAQSAQPPKPTDQIQKVEDEKKAAPSSTENGRKIYESATKAAGTQVCDPSLGHGCIASVGSVIRRSGDKNFPNTTNTDIGYNYLVKNSRGSNPTWAEVSAKDAQPGDVMIVQRLGKNPLIKESSRALKDRPYGHAAIIGENKKVFESLSAGPLNSSRSISDLQRITSQNDAKAGAIQKREYRFFRKL